MPLNVVIVCDYARPLGGAEKVAIDSSRGLAEAGCKVHYVAGLGPVDDALVHENITVHLSDVQELKHKRGADLVMSGLWATRCARMAERVLADLPGGQTVIHLHSWQRALTAAVLRACQRSGHPLVMTLHEYGTACPNQGFYDYQKHEICTRKALGASCLVTHCDTRTYFHKLWRASRTALQRVAAGVPADVRDVIFISELSRNVLQPYFQPSTRWHAVRNPIPVTQTSRVAAELNRDFLFIGRVSTEKGAELFAAGAAQAGVSAKLVGDGPQLPALREAYPGLTFLGWLDAANVQLALRSARALVFPSLWYETLGMVVQEALAAGVPVIVADGTAAREAVQVGENGVLFKHQDVSDLANRMAALAHDDEAIARMSAGAYRSYWSDPPTLESHVQSLQGVYRQCMATAG
jgi:glycosyltransferase involved in cell wall biosynthesis